MPKDNKETKDRSPVKQENRSPKEVFDRFLDDDIFSDPFGLFRSPRMLSLFNRNWFPRTDVSETNDEVKVIADVPGVDPDDINIDIRDRVLTIGGTVTRENTSDEKPYRYERSYGEFRREIVLPARVKEEEIRAVYKNGLLTVTLPKTEEEKRKKITIERE
jgi:HSP20 family protein